MVAKIDLSNKDSYTEYLHREFDWVIFIPKLFYPCLFPQIHKGFDSGVGGTKQECTEDLICSFLQYLYLAQGRGWGVAI